MLCGGAVSWACPDPSLPLSSLHCTALHCILFLPYSWKRNNPLLIWMPTLSLQEKVPSESYPLDLLILALIGYMRVFCRVKEKATGSSKRYDSCTEWCISIYVLCVIVTCAWGVFHCSGAVRKNSVFFNSGIPKKFITVNAERKTGAVIRERPAKSSSRWACGSIWQSALAVVAVPVVSCCVVSCRMIHCYSSPLHFTKQKCTCLYLSFILLSYSLFLTVLRS